MVILWNVDDSHQGFIQRVGNLGFPPKQFPKELMDCPPDSGALSSLWMMSCGIFIDIEICLPTLFVINAHPPPKRKILYETLVIGMLSQESALEDYIQISVMLQ